MQTQKYVLIIEYIKFEIIHWDVRYSAYQQPCDLMVKTFEWQPKEH